MRLTIDNYASYLYVTDKTDRKVAKTVELNDSLLVDYDENGEILGIEIMEEVKPEYYSDYKERVK